MKTIENRFSKYALKRKFGKEYIKYEENNRFYIINGRYILFEKVNKNQFMIHSAYGDSFMRIGEEDLK